MASTMKEFLENALNEDTTENINEAVTVGSLKNLKDLKDNLPVIVQYKNKEYEVNSIRVGDIGKSGMGLILTIK